MRDASLYLFKVPYGATAKTIAPSCVCKVKNKIATDSSLNKPTVTPLYKPETISHNLGIIPSNISSLNRHNIINSNYVFDPKNIHFGNPPSFAESFLAAENPIDYLIKLTLKERPFNQFKPVRSGYNLLSAGYKLHEFDKVPYWRKLLGLHQSSISFTPAEVQSMSSPYLKFMDDYLWNALQHDPEFQSRMMRNMSYSAAPLIAGGIGSSLRSPRIQNALLGSANSKIKTRFSGLGRGFLGLGKGIFLSRIGSTLLSELEDIADKGLINHLEDQYRINNISSDTDIGTLAKLIHNRSNLLGSLINTGRMEIETNLEIANMLKSYIDWYLKNLKYSYLQNSQNTSK